MQNVQPSANCCVLVFNDCCSCGEAEDYFQKITKGDRKMVGLPLMLLPKRYDERLPFRARTYMSTPQRFYCLMFMVESSDLSELAVNFPGITSIFLFKDTPETLHKVVAREQCTDYLTTLRNWPTFLMVIEERQKSRGLLGLRGSAKAQAVRA